MYWSVRFAAEVFGVKSFYMTESGATFEDDITPAGEVFDLHRREYIRSYLVELHRALAEGYDIRGYFVWTLLDNWEWAEGNKTRFGLVHVAFGTQRRTPKLSSRWYSEVIRHNRIV
jgi:beta-glucosidase